MEGFHGLHSLGLFLRVSVWVVLLTGCAGGGSSAGSPAAPIPAGVHPASSQVPPGVVRRTLSVPTCSGTGTGAFVGGGSANVADATDAAVLDGSSNQVCEGHSSIAGGGSNAISGSGAAPYSFIGSGLQNVITGSSTESAVIAGTSNVIAGNSYTSFIGSGTSNMIGTGNQPNSAIVAGDSNVISGASGGTSIIGAGYGNTISNAPWAVIGGGLTNALSAQYAFIGGGANNTLASTATYGAIAGGTNNNVSGEGGYIAAGGYNTLSGEGAVIDGGFNNTAAGTFATVPGGYVNSAAGSYSFAAGARASAAQTGTFVWSDGSDGDTILSSAQAYQFLARASGGFTLWTNAAGTVGAKLAPGSGTWASASDRNMKTDVVRLDDATVLAKVARLPISRWSYVSERGVRHVGPMAQDFYAAFGVGEDDKHITSIDEDGVALSAIKALHTETATLRAENARLRRQLGALRTAESRHDGRERLLATKLARIEALVTALARR